MEHPKPEISVLDVFLKYVMQKINRNYFLKLRDIILINWIIGVKSIADI